MRKSLSTICLVFVLLFTVSALAANKVVVVPLGGAVGNAKTADVLKGKTFSSKEGKGLVGTFSVVGYLDRGDGTVTDSATGLMWQKAEGQLYNNWHDAVAYCNTLQFPPGGYDDWRLPSKDELKGLVRCSNGQLTPLCDLGECWPDSCFITDAEEHEYDTPTIHDIFESDDFYYWTATTYNEEQKAWAVVFTDGSSRPDPMDWTFYARCVR
jgi:Protein of unknown function (DUF1566)